MSGVPAIPPAAAPDLTPGVGHNSNPAADRLRSYIERYERLAEERTALSGDMRDILGEAKSAGFDVKALRAVIGLRKKEAAEIEEQEMLIDTYRRALGM